MIEPSAEGRLVRLTLSHTHVSVRKDHHCLPLVTSSHCTSAASAQRPAVIQQQMPTPEETPAPSIDRAARAVWWAGPSRLSVRLRR